MAGKAFWSDESTGTYSGGSIILLPTVNESYAILVLLLQNLMKYTDIPYNFQKHTENGTRQWTSTL